MLNIDTVGGIPAIGGKDTWVQGAQAFSVLRQQFPKAVFREVTRWGSDHVCFHHAGVPVVSLISTEGGGRIHTPQDNYINAVKTGLPMTVDLAYQLLLLVSRLERVEVVQQDVGVLQHFCMIGSLFH